MKKRKRKKKSSPNPFPIPTKRKRKKKERKKVHSHIEESSVSKALKEPLNHRPNIPGIVRVDIESNGNNDKSAQTHTALEVITLAVLDKVVDDQHTEEKDDSFEPLEMERHFFADDPAEDDEERGDEEGDLHGAADGDADGEVHLVLVGDDAGGDVLGGVADDGEEDQADEGLADARGLDDGVDRVDEVFGADGDEDGDDDEADAGGDGAEDLRFFGFAAFVAFLGFGVEELGVRLELEVEVETVEDQHDDGGASGEEEDVFIRGFLALGQAGVEGGRDDQAGCRHSHKGGHGTGDGFVEAGFVTADTGSDEAAAEDEEDIG